MSCNPCCCWKLKDAAVSIGIWSAIYAVIQLGLFGWQMAAIKYEKDRAANTLLPNYNTYGRYDIPSYYESYWQSPEERYYTGLFVVQILCLIASFFLLFASVILIYGVHTWSRALLWPWLICMCCSILTSLAYCITWWAGDVRDYWLVLTILQFFGVVVNCYCFVVIWVFYKNMADELRYYEGRRNKKYNHFNQRAASHAAEHDVENNDFSPPESYPNTQLQNWNDHPWPSFDPNMKYFADVQPTSYRPPYDRGKMPPERFDNLPVEDSAFEDDGFDLNHSRLQPAKSMPTLFDDFKDVPRQHQRTPSRRKHCSRCDHRHHHTHSHCHRKHSRRHSRRKKVESCSSTCSTDLTTEDTVSTNPQGGRRRHRSHHEHKSHCRRSESKTKRRNGLLDEENQATLDLTIDRMKTKSTRSAVIQVDPNELTPPPINPQTFSPATGGISIPQHIVIPPENDTDPATSGQPRKYQINSEITISYNPRTQAITSTSPLRSESRQQFGVTTPASPVRLPSLNVTSTLLPEPL